MIQVYNGVHKFFGSWLALIIHVWLEKVLSNSFFFLCHQRSSSYQTLVVSFGHFRNCENIITSWCYLNWCLWQVFVVTKYEAFSVVLYIVDFAIRSRVTRSVLLTFCLLDLFFCVSNNWCLVMLHFRFFFLSDVHCFSLLVVMTWCKTTLCPQNQFIFILCKFYSNASVNFSRPTIYVIITRFVDLIVCVCVGESS